MISRRCALQCIALNMMLARINSVARGEPRRPSRTQHTAVVVDSAFGTKGDGKTNDRFALQRAIDESVGKTLLITGDCRIDATGLTLRTNSHVQFAPGASISLLAHNTADYQMMRAWDIQHVLLENPRLSGSRQLNAAVKNPSGAGFGMGISIAGSADIRIESPVTTDCWGDGIYIANSYTRPNSYSTCIRVFNHYASGCRRQGVSIISGKDILFDSPVWENIGGTLPSAGLDIEPDDNKDVLERIRIVRPTTRHCLIGILVYLSSLPGAVHKDIDIEIDQHRDEESVQAAYSVYGVREKGSAVSGRVVSRSPTWRRSGRVPFVTSDIGPGGPTIEVVNRTVIP
ncbi:hypothetical protein GCT13_27775 [Paraburkholderia sp. CNPSo 3157]|uniref:Pectate lyase superfamily protein domain-containing protein n=1 Tax=Paraburkholderia franconis TaxID=2654983 RepID=A0A7X1TIJ9_9BURK|nr:hypothetical protein [Paraburkholderia franconis]MPW20578.1 hypothetical protein [Paraburkholderia franconis]